MQFFAPAPGGSHSSPPPRRSLEVYYNSAYAIITEPRNIIIIKIYIFYGGGGGAVTAAATSLTYRNWVIAAAAVAAAADRQNRRASQPRSSVARILQYRSRACSRELLVWCVLRSVREKATTFFAARHDNNIQFYQPDNTRDTDNTVCTDFFFFFFRAPKLSPSEIGFSTRR